MKKLLELVYVSITLFFVIVFLKFEELFHWLTEEDMLVEWSTFVLFFLAFVISTRKIWLEYNKKSYFDWFMILIAIGCLFVAGEEISWGQRFFGFDTPEMIKSVNFQNEMTLHNIGNFGKNWIRRIFMLSMFFYLIVIPLVVNYHKRVKQFLSKIRFVIPKTDLIILFLCSLILPCYVKYCEIFESPLPKYHDYAMEVTELYAGLIFLDLVVSEARKIK